MFFNATMMQCDNATMPMNEEMNELFLIAKKVIHSFTHSKFAHSLINYCTSISSMLNNKTELLGIAPEGEELP